MKLSEKGLKRLLDVAFDGDEFYQSNALQIEFEPDDFDGCFQNGKDHIALTVEEAKAVNEAIEWLCSTLEDYEREHDNTPALIEGWNQMDFLEHRIEQAEGKR